MGISIPTGFTLFHDRTSSNLLTREWMRAARLIQRVLGVTHERDPSVPYEGGAPSL